MRGGGGKRKVEGGKRKVEVRIRIDGLGLRDTSLTSDF